MQRQSVFRAPDTSKGGLFGYGLAAAATAALFMVIPLTQRFTAEKQAEDVNPLEEVSLPPPPPPPPPPPEQEEQPEEAEMLEMKKPVPEITLDQIETFLEVGTGSNLQGDWSFNVDLSVGEMSLDIFELEDIDEPPVPVSQKSPDIPYRLRREGAEVVVLFVVDEQGRVTEPVIERSTNSAFNRSVLEAIRRWRFKPGSRGGETVKVRMRQPFVIRPN